MVSPSLNRGFQPDREFCYSRLWLNRWIDPETGHIRATRDKEVVMLRWPIRLKLIVGLSVVV